ncbi:PREDICTED: solute carrier family 52, riboflavin transporter, member 3-B-like [Branchiostoma belcheri]|uniref:Riboflavin transporter n=1 Tax=Branchiostoma belcheri TaxID=7741 RepID=A0A6P4ZKR8_BRABE|nr:PREDICTED: solute carrier family 52, riboflavin transporter, member 3-B-like [Branchiostoma belcheri]
MKKLQVNPFVYFLAILFGCGSWIAFNGLWVELPIIVQHAPEGWSLPSYLSVIIAMANVGPIAFTLASVLAPGRVSVKAVVYTIVSIGIVSCALLPFFWKYTIYIAGANRSVALLLLAFLLGVGGCTSSVAFMPFMAVFTSPYLNPYFIGEGMSGLVPSLVALGQGVGGNPDCQNVSFVNSTVVDGVLTNITEYTNVYVTKDPNFPVENFFWFLFAMMLACGIAFLLLNHLPLAKKEQVDAAIIRSAESPPTDGCSNPGLEMESVETKGSVETSTANESDVVSCRKTVEVNNPVADGRGKDYLVAERKGLSRGGYVYLLCVEAWVNALSNGVLPSIQSYSCLPYGNTAYHLAVTLANMANPLACFISFFLPTTSFLLVGVLSLAGTAVGAYILVLAAMSPTPVLLGTDGGVVLVILAWISVVGLFSYVKVTIGSIFREEGQRALLYCGAVMQAGSCVGAIVTFLFVNVFPMFQQNDACDL